MQKERKPFPSFLRFVLIVLGIFFLLLLFGHSNNLIHWVQAKVDIHRMETEIRRCERETHQLQQRMKDLRENPDTLERYARERYGLTDPDEDVFLVE